MFSLISIHIFPLEPVRVGGLFGVALAAAALDRADDFSVSLHDSAGDYHSFTREGGVPAVEIHDPLKAHTDLLAKYTDADIHNLTAYLVTLK